MRRPTSARRRPVDRHRGHAVQALDADGHPRAVPTRPRLGLVVPTLALGGHGPANMTGNDRRYGSKLPARPH
jgi:hypothetical protein